MRAPTASLLAAACLAGVHGAFHPAHAPPLTSRQPQKHVGVGPHQPTLLPTVRGGSCALCLLRGGTLLPSLGSLALQPAVVTSSLKAVAELLTCCGFGVLATRVGLLDAPTTRALARCVYNVFLPAMLCSSVASTVAAGAGWSLLPLPIAAWVQVALGLCFAGAIVGPRTLRSPSGRDVAALASFGNAGVLPLIFADCLFRAQPALHARANALVAMFLLGWSPLFWTLGFSLLSARTSSSDAADAAAVDASRANRWVLLRKRVLTPPIVGCLVGIVAGGLPPLRALLVPPASPLPLHRALEVFGKAYSPAALLVLASSLALPKPSAAPRHPMEALPAAVIE